MEIRRVDPELIPPTTASDHSGRVVMNRKQSKRSKEQQRKNDPPQDETSDEQADVAAGEHQSAHATTYNPEGHVQQQGDSEQESHTIDFKV